MERDVDKLEEFFSALALFAIIGVPIIAVLYVLWHFTFGW